MLLKIFTSIVKWDGRRYKGTDSRSRGRRARWYGYGRIGRPELGEDGTEYDEEGEGEGWDQIDMDYQKTQPDQLTIEELHQQLQHVWAKVETADSLAKGIESLIEQGGLKISISKYQNYLDKVIISNKAIHKICAENWEGYRIENHLDMM